MSIYRLSKRELKELQQIEGLTVYVDGESPDCGCATRGSKALPFQTIQEGIDYVEALPDVGVKWGVVRIAPGSYDENIVVTKNCIALFGESGGVEVGVEPTSGVPLTVTNATKESLAAYRISGDYSDLVNDGAGPGDFFCREIFFGSWYGEHAAEFLGVKGDFSETQTDFGWFGPYWRALVVSHCHFSGDSVFVKNANLLSIFDSYGMEILAYNYGSVELFNSSFNGTRDPPSSIFATYDVASPDGEPSLGNTGYFATFGSGAMKVEVSGTAMFGNPNHPNLNNMSMDSLLVKDSSVVNATNGYILENVEVDGGGFLTLRHSIINGNLIVDAGAGVVTLADTDVYGQIIDPSNKIIFATSKNVRYGYEQRVVLSIPNLAQNAGGGGNTQMQIDAFDYKIDGWVYHKGAAQDIAVSESANTGVGEYKAITVAIDANGTISQTCSSVASSTPVQPPMPPVDECPIAVVQIPQSFTPGVTVFDTVWVTNGYRYSI